MMSILLILILVTFVKKFKMAIVEITFILSFMMATYLEDISYAFLILLFEIS